MRKERWQVYGEFGGRFTTLKEACSCAKEASTYAGLTSVVLIEDGCIYFEYENGKKVYDGWTIKK